MTERTAFLASAKDPIFNEMVWIPANGEFAHHVTLRRNRVRDDGSLDYRKDWFDISFALGKVSTTADLIRMMFYGDPSWHKTVNDFMGLSKFYNSIDPTKAQNAVNVVDGGGKESLSSIYLVDWSENNAFMAYQVDDAGELHAALVPKDWRYIVRVANVDENTDKPMAMTKALLSLPTLGGGAAFYMRSPFAEEYRGVPIREVGALQREKRVVYPPSIDNSPSVTYHMTPICISGANRCHFLHRARQPLRL